MDRGKQHEQWFKKTWEKSVKDSFCFRLADQVTGYKTTSQNPSDFICYKEPNIYFMECKAHKGKSIPFDAIPQYDRLLKFAGISGVRCGVIIWLYETDCPIIYLPISTIKQMKKDGEKSFGLRHMNDDKYKYYLIPGEHKVVFWDSDFSYLVDNLKDGE